MTERLGDWETGRHRRLGDLETELLRIEPGKRRNIDRTSSKLVLSHVVAKYWYPGVERSGTPGL
jgi:hypothetical protein